MYEVFERYNGFDRVTFYGMLNENMNQLFLKDFSITSFHNLAIKICMPEYFTTTICTQGLEYKGQNRQLLR